MKPINFRSFLMLFLFALAMGMLESAVVVYLRELYYPEGFAFPMQSIGNPVIVLTELLREAATLLMLVGIGYFFGHNFITRFAGFLYSFAVWDIFYYVFLKLLLNWPESLLTWDVLFLLPMVWTGPVYAPVLVSLVMIAFAHAFVHMDKRLPQLRFRMKHMLWLLLPTAVIFISFILDPLRYLLQHSKLSAGFAFAKEDIFAVMQDYVPHDFNEVLFFAGLLGLMVFLFLFWKQGFRNNVT